MARGGMRLGAGRPARRVKADDCYALDIREIARRGLLLGSPYSWEWRQAGKRLAWIRITPGWESIRLNYTVNGRPVGAVIRVQRTVCGFGGSRPWFLCPRCGQRVALLYLTRRHDDFICRGCGDICYASQSDDDIDRLWRRQHRLQARLGKWNQRPKGMHQATHSRLLNDIAECELLRDVAIENHLLRMSGRRHGGRLASCAR